MKSRRRPIVRHLVIYSALAPFLVIALFPVVWWGYRRCSSAGTSSSGGALMAGGLLVGPPVALLFAAVLDRFVQALTGPGHP